MNRCGHGEHLDVVPNSRASMLRRLRFATSNAGKLAEAQDFLLSAGVTLEGVPSDIIQQIVEPQSPSLKEISSSKLEQVLGLFDDDGVPTFVEDAGLFIEAWAGFPGPFSSFVHSTLGCSGVISLMRGLSDRRAHFKAMIAMHIDGKTHHFEGRIDGSIAHSIDGDKGFGFDPIFIPEGETSTFARLGDSYKRGHSHRAGALENLLHLLLQED